MIGFIAGFIFGSLVAHGVGYLIHRKVMRKAIADAETAGIQRGAILESELGWHKKK